MRRAASCSRSAIVRRRPMTGMSSTSPRLAGGPGLPAPRYRHRDPAGSHGRPARCRPPGASRCRARRRAFAPRARRAAAPRPAGGPPREGQAPPSARRGRRPLPRAPPGPPGRRDAASATSSVANSDPTGRLSPTAPPSPTTVPDTGDGISTVAFSVITSTSGSSSRIISPGLTCQATISASVMPSPMSGSLTT